MAIKMLTAQEASAATVKLLGLDSDAVDLSTSEVLAACLRRAAAFMCPASPGSLVNAVLGTLRPLTGDDSLSRELVTEVLDSLISGGDLLELKHDVDDLPARLLYLGPPSFIEKSVGEYLILGVRPFAEPILHEGLFPSIEHEGTTRTIALDPDRAVAVLSNAGLQQIERSTWVARPRIEAATELIGRLGKQLDSAGSGGVIEGLQLLDPTTSVRYYRGRWRSPTNSDSGVFVARRPQIYGADLWCVVRIDQGMTSRMLQFPIDDPLVPARDEAWRVQMAIDAARGAPQYFSIESSADSDFEVVKFFAPVPSFAERYLRLIGIPLPKLPGALFGYRIRAASSPELVAMLQDTLWIQPKREDDSR